LATAKKLAVAAKRKGVVAQKCNTTQSATIATCIGYAKSRNKSLNKFKTFLRLLATPILVTLVADCVVFTLQHPYVLQLQPAF